ncbi:MAG: ABC transporter ATP-binding protein [Myxococcales bacterium]|nr:ABC transporter ATP-binding protein [Myxococcales bacterium]
MATPSNIHLAKRFWRYARPDAMWLWLGLAAVPLGTLAGLAQPWLLKEAIDGPITQGLAQGAGPEFTRALTELSVLFVGAAFVEFVLRGGQLFALQRVGYRALQRLRRAIYQHVMHQGLGFFDKRARGSLLSRSTNDVEAIGEILGFGIVGVVGDVVSIVSIVGTMLYFDARLTAISLIVAPIVVGIVNFFRRQLRKYSVDIRVSMAEATGHFSEALSGHEIVQLHGREAQTVTEYKRLNYSYLRAYHRANWYDASLYAIMDGVSGLSIALLIWYGSGRYVEGELTLGLLFAFIQYIQRLFVPVRELSGKVATIERAMASLSRIFGLMDVDERHVEGGHAPETVRGAITMSNLSFRYRDDGPEVLSDISLRIAPGEVVALVGPTGSGKSTIGKLIGRMYAAPDSTVLIDGVPVEQWQRAALHRAVGVVQQDVTLFSGTIRDNVTLGRAGIDDSRVHHALAQAQLADKVSKLGGLDAELDEGGANLSTGERQLLSIARVLATNPPIIVLDEATASIDSLTEQAVQKALEAVFTGRSVLVVAHRLSTIRKASHIVVLQAGRIVERGDHESLMAAEGAYAHLVREGQLRASAA